MKAREEILLRVQSAKVAAPDHETRRDYAHTVTVPDPVDWISHSAAKIITPR